MVETQSRTDPTTNEGAAETELPLQVLLTFDFEEWEGRYEVYQADLYGKTERIVNLLKDRELPATFFLDAYTVSQYPDAARLLSREGFELALHSDYHYGAVRDSNDRKRPRLVEVPDFRQDSDTQISRIREAIATIKQVISGFAPLGFRAPGLKWNEELYISLSKLGFLYDSSQRGEVFRPFVMKNVVVLPMNCGDYDSAAYKLRPTYVLNVWMDNFKRVCRAAREAGDAYYLLLAHPSVSGKHKYIGLLKGILNYMSWHDIQYLTCSEMAMRHTRRLTG